MKFNADLSLSFYINMVGRSVGPDHLESCASASRQCAACRVTHVRQVEGRGQIKGILISKSKFLEELITYFPDTWTKQKMMPPIILHFHGNVFTELLPSNNMGIYRHTRTDSPLIRQQIFLLL
jgi:hypothetical protein